MSLEYRGEDHPDSDVDALRTIVIPPPIYTLIILICIGAVTVAQLITGYEYSVPTAAFDKLMFRQGEYWRILTGIVSHGFLLHAFMNGYALYSFGRLMELLANRAHLATVFLLSALGGSLLSLYFLPDESSVGASGGIVGLIGYLLVYAFRRRRFISAEFRKSLLINIAFILVFGLVLYQIVDNYGHIGGLLVGIFYGLIQIPSNEYVNPQNATVFSRVLGVVSLGIYIVSTGLALLIILSGR
ncbi:MAG TPA: rhomboid family intramembrane serine protease [Pyrinomonadaceae bacterium]